MLRPLLFPSQPPFCTFPLFCAFPPFCTFPLPAYLVPVNLFQIFPPDASFCPAFPHRIFLSQTALSRVSLPGGLPDKFLHPVSQRGRRQDRTMLKVYQKRGMTKGVCSEHPVGSLSSVLLCPDCLLFLSLFFSACLCPQLFLLKICWFYLCL